MNFRWLSHPGCGLGYGPQADSYSTLELRECLFATSNDDNREIEALRRHFKSEAKAISADL